jgi:hypothetical protein
LRGSLIGEERISDRRCGDLFGEVWDSLMGDVEISDRKLGNL